MSVSASRARRASGLLVFMLLPGMVCAEAAQEETVQRDDVEIRVEVTNARGQAVSRFAPGEPVHVRLALTNHGSKTVSLPFSSTRTHDAVVSRADGSEVWRWSEGRRFAQMLSELALEPGASEAFEAACDPSRPGQPELPPGSYEVVGIIPALGRELRSAPVRFAVER